MATENPLPETADNEDQTTEVETEQKPTVLTDVTKQEDQEPGQEVENLDDPENSDDKSGDAEGSDATDDEENVLYLELDDKEHSLDDVRTWRDGHMMQSDYTKKTTVLAEERTSFETERDTSRENLLKSQSEVSEMRDLLAVLVQEDEEIDWVKLKEDEPEEYIELKEKADKRREALEKVKTEATPVNDPATIATESGKLFAANPKWLDEDGNRTEVFDQDSKLMSAYAARVGFVNDEFKNMVQSHHLMTILKAAKYDQLQEKGRKIKAKREKVPLITKPKAKAAGAQPKSTGEIFFPNVN